MRSGWRVTPGTVAEGVDCNVKASTIDVYRDNVERHVLPALPTKRLADIRRRTAAN